jgi:hypothetical protein
MPSFAVPAAYLWIYQHRAELQAHQLTEETP